MFEYIQHVSGMNESHTCLWYDKLLLKESWRGGQ